MNMNQTPPPEYIQPQPPPQPIQVAIKLSKPVVTYVIMGLTVLIYLLQMAGQSLLGTDLVLALGVKYNDAIRNGELWRLVTPVFLHGSILHIAFNMYALFIYGRELEARYGTMRFTLLYFLAAFSGNVLSFLLTVNPSVGASTAVFGLLAAEGIFVFQNRKLLGKQANRVLGNVLFIAGINLFLGFTTSGVDNFGHLGGLLGGMLFAWFGGPRWKLDGFYPMQRLIDEREGHGALTGSLAVLLFFIPLTILGWIWPK